MTSLDEVRRYPAGITPHGEHHLLSGDKPMVHFHSHDDTIDFRLLGGLAAPYHDPNQAAVSVNSLAGLLAPWQFITQKGATQHGVTTVGSLNDPIEITAEVDLIGPDAKTTMQLVRDWIDANEQMKTGELAVITHELGRWWTDARWTKTPPNKILGAHRRRQPFTQTWTVDSSFWQTYPVTDVFRLTHTSDVDPFDIDHNPGLGDGWDLQYAGDGGAYIRARAALSAATWVDDPDDPIETYRSVVCRRAAFATEGNDQVVELTLNGNGVPVSEFGRLGFPEGAEIHLWARMKTTGTPGGDGIRAQITRDRVRLSYFIAGVETVLRDESVPNIYAVPGYETFTFICGDQGNTRKLTLLRNGIPIITHVEGSTGGSQIGPSYRGAGFGMRAGPGGDYLSGLNFSIPPSVGAWSAGDNIPVTGSGFVKLLNIGDQPMPPRYTCFGPGLFTFANGPGSTDYVQFGPLLPNQVMQVNTDPEQRPVVDMTSVPPTPQELDQFQRALQDFVSFATAGNVPPLLQQIESMFGILPPQGHPYSLLSGAFSNPIPPKTSGKPAAAHHIAVSIAGGNANSMILAAGTPLRRWPL